MGSLKMALIVLKFLYSSYWKEVNLCHEYGLGEILDFGNLL